MRTTIDLPPELHAALLSIASSNRKSLSQTAVDLIRRGLGPAPLVASEPGRCYAVSEATGLPLVQLPRAISAEDVRALDDER